MNYIFKQDKTSWNINPEHVQNFGTGEDYVTIDSRTKHSVLQPLKGERRRYSTWHMSHFTLWDFTEFFWGL